MKLAWLTDIHLDHCTDQEVIDFCKHITAQSPDGIALTGDIAEGQNISDYLQLMAKYLDNKPLYFVLGNHDYYNSSIQKVRQEMIELTNSDIPVYWMNHIKQSPLTSNVGIIGHDGWSDGRFGDYLNSTIRLKDYRLIKELAEADEQDQLWQTLQHLGDSAAEEVESFLPEALEQFEHLIFLTHPPPFKEACWYLNEMTADDNWLPHFTCKAVGNVLHNWLKKYPQKSLTVLAGHTHNACDVEILPNLRVKVGKAEYGQPEIQYPILEF